MGRLEAVEVLAIVPSVEIPCFVGVPGVCSKRESADKALKGAMLRILNGRCYVVGFFMHEMMEMYDELKWWG